MSYAYVGCRTTRERNARGKGLKAYEISEATGEWKEIQCLETQMLFCKSARENHRSECH